MNDQRMDLNKIIHQLMQEKRQLDTVIAFLETLEHQASTGRTDPASIGHRRGRKSMPPEERRRVSERMKEYWHDRRASRDGTGVPAPQENSEDRAGKRRSEANIAHAQHGRRAGSR